MLGQVFIRKTGKIVNGKEAVIIAGIVSLGLKEQEELKSEHQYIITSANLSQLHARDISHISRGNGIDGLLTSPIWRLWPPV